MGKLNKIGILVAFVVFILNSSFVHEYYVSITNVYVNKEQKQFEIELKVDAEDLEKVLFIENGKRINLEKIDEDAFSVIEKYIAKHFQFTINGGIRKIELVGEELDPDGNFWCFITVDLPDVIQAVKIKNDILLPTFLQQHNIVNLKINEKTYSHTYIHKHTFHTFKINEK